MGSYQGIDFGDDNGFTLIIALDCGIKSVDHVVYAKEKGIDFIICDHHRPGAQIPNAVAVLDPKQEDCFIHMMNCVDVVFGFKLIQVLSFKRNITIFELIPYLDLVATALQWIFLSNGTKKSVLANYLK